jgi:hypothetical protein
MLVDRDLMGADCAAKVMDFWAGDHLSQVGKAVMSSQRIWAWPCSVGSVSIERVQPNPVVEIRSGSTPAETSTAFAAFARSTESF